MALALVIIFLVSTVAFGCVLALGMEAASARKYIARAATLAQQQEFDEARKSVLVAVRLNPAFKTNPDVQILYDIIAAKSKDASVYEIDRIISAIPQWPKSKWKKMVEDPRFQVTMVVIIVISIILRLTAR